MMSTRSYRRRLLTAAASTLLVAALLTAAGQAPAQAAPIAPDANLKVAFLGDSGVNANASAVLNLIKNQGAQLAIHTGDMGYGASPASWESQLNSVLGANFPYLYTVGNHDTEVAGRWADYQTRQNNRIGRIPGLACSGDTGVKSVCTYRGLWFLLSGAGTLGSGHDTYIRDQCATANHTWKVVNWHKNQKAMQVGGKSDEAGWPVYEETRQCGAIASTSHEHSYERTRTLTSMQNQTVDPTCGAAASLCVDPGRTFAFVSGLGGASIRDQQRCLPTSFPYGCKQEWGKIYTSNQGAKYGALFITFNVDGDPNKARGEFINVSGAVVDSFTITTAGTTPPTTGITADQVAPGAITVDGNLSEAAWKHGQADLPYGLSRTILGTWNNTARYSTLWNSSYLYVAARITDAALHNDSAAVPDDDSIDIYVDRNHNHGVTYDVNDNFYQKGWNDPGISAKNGNVSGVLHAWRAIPGGYEVEVAIPWANLDSTPSTPTPPTAGDTVGFDIASNDDDNGGTRDGQAMAFGTTSNWQNTSAFGDLTLLGIPAPPVTADQVATGEITVDGNISEAVWNAGQPDLPYWLSREVFGTWNNQARYSALWSTTHLYVAMRVTDAALHNDSAAIMDDDSVEVYVDGDHSHGGYGPADNQYLKGWNDTGLFARNGNTTGVLHAWRAISGGYEVELAIPWANLGVNPTIGSTIGFDVGNNDDDNGSTRDGQALAFGGAGNSTGTTGFGHLLLRGMPAHHVNAGTITVDGSVSEADWKHGQPSLPYGAAKALIGVPNNTTRYSVLWNETYLYVGIRVTDAALHNDSVNVQDDDSVDVYVDGNHNHATSYGADDNFYQKGWNDAPVKAKNANTTGVLHGWSAVSGGYEVELAIPWANLGVIPAEGNTIGFDIAGNDDDNAGARDSQQMAFGTSSNWTDTSAFGHLTLVNSIPAPILPFGWGQPGGPSGSWIPTFSDEFAGATLDTAKWGVGYGWGTSTGHSIEKIDAAHTYVEGGNLVFKVEEINGEFWSGAVNTKTAAQPYGQTLGYFETRSKSINANGMISAFWGKRMSEEWPPELDVNETFDTVCPDTSIKRNRAHASVHWGTTSNHSLTNRSWCLPDNGPSNDDFTDDFHIYAVEWRTDAVIQYVDGIERGRMTAADGINFAQLNGAPFYWMANVHVCGFGDVSCRDAVNVFPAYMYTDYIRIWRR